MSIFAILFLMRQTRIPAHLQSVLWSSDINKLDIAKDKQYIIHQILSHGRMEDIAWLFKTYERDHIRSVFTNIPYKNYRLKRYHFVKKYLLSISDVLNQAHYVENTPRDLG